MSYRVKAMGEYSAEYNRIFVDDCEDDVSEGDVIKDRDTGLRYRVGKSLGRTGKGSHFESAGQIRERKKRS